MGIEFENKFYTNDEMLKEYVNKVLSKYARRIFLVYILIFLFIVKNGILKKTAKSIHNDQSYPTLVQFGNNIFM